LTKHSLYKKKEKKKRGKGGKRGGERKREGGGDPATSGRLLPVASTRGKGEKKGREGRKGKNVIPRKANPYVSRKSSGHRPNRSLLFFDVEKKKKGGGRKRKEGEKVINGKGPSLACSDTRSNESHQV